MRIVGFLFWLCLAAPVSAAEFYVDPAAGNDANDGTAARPWRTLQAVIEGGKVETRHWNALPYQQGRSLVVVNAGAPVKAGDTLWLRSGYHGELVLRGAYNAAPITIAALPGHTPRLKRVQIDAAQHWVLRGLSISPSHAAPISTSTIATVQDHSWHGPAWDIVIESSDIFTVANTAGWGVNQWLNNVANGVSIQADRIALRNSRIRNVRHGLDVSGEDAHIAGNTIDGFSADGMRGLGDRGVYEYNRVLNSYVDDSLDGNHDDGFQSWSVGAGGVGTGEVRGVVLRSNVFIISTDPARQRPLRSTMQGIGCFDGFFSDWIVENNVVVTDHWHGITFLGMRDSRIVNNTVVDFDTVSPGPPWIMVAAHKDGRASQNVVVRNNLAMSFTLEGGSITDDRNRLIGDTAAHFVAWPYDLRLKPGAPGIDMGSPLLAPALDVRRTPRPQGLAVDLGAYESCPGAPCPADLPAPRNGSHPLLRPRGTAATAAATAVATRPAQEPARAPKRSERKAPARKRYATP